MSFYGDGIIIIIIIIIINIIIIIIMPYSVLNIVLLFFSYTG